MDKDIAGIADEWDKTTGAVSKSRREQSKQLGLMSDDYEKTGKTWKDTNEDLHEQLGMLDKDFGRTTRTVRTHTSAVDDDTRSTRSATKEKRNLAKSVVVANQALALMSRTISLMKWPAMITGAGLAAQGLTVLAGGAAALTGSLSSAAGGAVAMVGALGPLVGLGTQLGAVYGALGQTMLALKLSGFKDLTDAMGGNEEAMKRLTGEGRKFADFLKGLKPQFDNLKRGLQEQLFAGFQAGIKNAMQNFGAFRKAMVDTGATIGQLAEKAGKLLGSEGFGSRFAKITATNNIVLRRMGGALLDVVDGLSHMLVAAKPLTMWSSRLFQTWGRGVKEWGKTGKETGRLNTFFKHTQQITSTLLGTFGHLYVALKNIGSIGRSTGLGLFRSMERGTKAMRAWTESGEGVRTLRNYFDNARESLSKIWGVLKPFGAALIQIGHLGREAGNDLLGSMGRAAEEFNEWTRSAEGRNSIRQFFEDIKPPLREFGRLIADVTKGFFQIAQGNNLTPLLQQLRTELLPPIIDLLRTTANRLGPEFVSLLTALAKSFIHISGASGPLIVTMRIMTKLFQGINVLLNNQFIRSFVVWSLVILSVGRALKTLIAIGAAFKSAFAVQALMGIVGAFRGIVTWGKNATVATRAYVITQAAMMHAAKGFAVLKGAAVGAFQAIVGGATGAKLAVRGLLLASGIGALIVAATLVVEHWDKIKPHLQAVWEWMKRAGANVAEWIKNAWAKIKGPIIGTWNAIVAVAKRTWAIIKGGANTMADVMKRTWKIVSGAARIAWNVIKTAVKVAFTAIKLWTTPFRHALVILWKVISTAAKVAWNLIKGAAKFAFNAIKTIAKPVIGFLVGAFNKVKNVGTDVWGWIKEAAKNAWNWIKGAWGDLGEFLGRPFRALRDQVKQMFHAVKTIIRDVFNWVKDKVEWILDKLDFVKDKAEDVGGFLMPGGDTGVGSDEGVLGIGGVPVLHTGGQVWSKDNVEYFQRGGMAGPRGSDNIPAWLTPGEIVLSVEAVRKLKAMAQKAMGGGPTVTEDQWDDAVTETEKAAKQIAKQLNDGHQRTNKMTKDWRDRQTKHFRETGKSASRETGLLNVKVKKDFDNILRSSEKTRRFKDAVTKDFSRMHVAAGTSSKRLKDDTSRNADRMKQDVSRHTGALRASVGKDFERTRTAGTGSTEKLRRAAVGNMSETKSGMVRESGQMKNGIAKDFDATTNVVKRALGMIESQLNKALSALGVKKISFTAKSDKGSKQERQRGGLIAAQNGLSFVGGHGFGDKVPALLEPGEVVWNREAVKKTFGSASAANLANTIFPRFQEGGIVQAFATGGGVEQPPGDPGEEVVQAGYGEEVGKFLQAYKMDLTQGYGGASSPSVSPGHTTLGVPPSLDVIPLGGLSWDGLFAQGLKWALSQGMQVGYDGQYGTQDWSNHGEGNHAHIDWKGGKGAALTGAGGLLGMWEDLPRVSILGPDGPLKELAQAATDKAWGAANQYGESKSGSVGTYSGGVLSREEFIAFALKALELTGHFAPTQANAEKLLFQAISESGLDPNAINLTDSNADAGYPSQGLLQTIPQTFAQYHEPGTANSITDPLANIAAAINYMYHTYGHIVSTGSGYRLGGIVELMAGGIAKLQRGTGGYGGSGAGPHPGWGGTAETGGGGGNTSLNIGDAIAIGGGGGGPAGTPVAPGMGPMELYPLLGSRDPATAGKALNQIMSIIHGYGLDRGIAGSLTKYSGEMDLFEEYAGYAQSLEGLPGMAGKFQGGDQKHWLFKELLAALSLRNTLLVGHQNLVPQISSVGNLASKTSARLKKVQGDLKKAQEKLADIAEKRKKFVKDVADAKTDLDDAQKKIDTARRELEAELRKNPKNQNQSLIRDRREKIEKQQGRKRGAQHRIQHGNKRIKQLDEAKKMWKDRAGRASREIAKLEDPIIPEWGTTLENVTGMDAAILTGGGEGFKSLQEVQGSKQSMNLIKGIPSFGSLGGSIFSIQARLKELTTGEEPDREKELELERQLRVEAQQRANVSQLQYPVFRDFFGAKFGGVFHKGGTVPGRRGEDVHILAKAGEVVNNPSIVNDSTGGGGTEVTVKTIVEDGAVNEDRIRHVVDTRERQRISGSRRRVGGR
jgi:hypothetical protein